MADYSERKVTPARELSRMFSDLEKKICNDIPDIFFVHRNFSDSASSVLSADLYIGLARFSH